MICITLYRRRKLMPVSSGCASEHCKREWVPLNDVAHPIDQSRDQDVAQGTQNTLRPTEIIFMTLINRPSQCNRNTNIRISIQLAWSSYDDCTTLFCALALLCFDAMSLRFLWGYVRSYCYYLGMCTAFFVNAVRTPSLCDRGLSDERIS